jgi:hypothetical protein
MNLDVCLISGVAGYERVQHARWGVKRSIVCALLPYRIKQIGQQGPTMLMVMSITDVLYQLGPVLLKITTSTLTL